MRVLIVGCGYIGTALGRELAGCGHEVFGLRRSNAAEATLRAAGIHPVAADVTRLDSLKRLPGPFDWVVNTVSSARGGLDEYRASYLEGTKQLLRWLESQPPRRFLYTSSTGVYGQNDGSLVTESSPAEPATPTARILVETERCLLDTFATSGFPALVLRVAGIYGPERTFFLRQFLSGEARLSGDGGRILNMVHRDDVAGAIRAALENGRPGEIYNVADDEPVTQLQFFEWLAKTLGRPLPPSVPEGIAEDRKRGLTSKQVSNRRLKSELGYAFRFPTFREGYAAEIADAQGRRLPGEALPCAPQPDQPHGAAHFFPDTAAACSAKDLP